MQARAIEAAFDSDLARAKNWNDRQQIISQRDFEASEYWCALSAIRSLRLTSRAHKLYISLENLKWEDDQFGNRYLNWDSEIKLGRAVQEETRRLWEFRLKIVTGVLANLTGIIGAFGLAAILTK